MEQHHGGSRVEPSRTEIDGVTTFWVDTGRPTLGAQLLFRTGMVDERLPQSGWTHLVEHLTLHGSQPGTLEVNGAVGLLTTSFTAHGPVEAVARHLEEVARRLTRPDTSDLVRERRVLAAEARRRGGPVPRALAQRFGARGPGTVSYGELGLSRATAELLHAWAAGRFTRGNAVLVLDGPPPPSLTLPLPEGQRLDVPPAQPVETVLPAMYVDESGLVVSGTVPRTHAATIFSELVGASLVDLLRHDKGAAYAPWSVYERVDAEQAVVVAGSDVAPDLLPSLATTALNWVSGRRYESDVVQAQVDRRLQDMSDPYAAGNHAAATAYSWLLGDEVLTTAERLDAVRRVTPADVAAVADAWRQSLLLGIPGETTWREQVRRSAPRRRSPEKGRVHRHRNWPAVVDRLIVTGDGIVQAQPRRGELVHTFDPRELEIVGRSADGSRFLVDADGWPFALDPREWSRGASIVKAIDDAAPSDRTVDLPPTDGPAWRRASWWQRWTHRLRHRTTRAQKLRIVVAMALLSPFLLLLAPRDGGELPSGAVVGMVWLVVGAVWVLQSSAFEPD